ncbi:acyl-CoA synthetase FdrA [Ornithinibacillus halophilus]|uniref:FdrA protein n=1 Tax=Ornithinibacillus halophilus TaxID=930117 RepID=A0A1M5N8Z1_9BACI|nr:acyl-CoA synthetase FdrA [Ornithinibacillus halophilus]SHG85957.1 FdrA protein [Ornithinibacillus halophilus]
MLHTIIKKNSYQDSVNLMLLTNAVSVIEGINKIQIMMGTPANKDIFKGAGLYTDELEKAEANDMCIVLDTDNEDKIDEVLAAVDDYLKNQSISKSGSEFETVRTFDRAMKALPDANLAVISVPGSSAAIEADKALDNGLNVFMFSDNVSFEDERRLKEKAHDKGLLVMGPDCGTGIISSIPIAFTNVVKEGKIGIVGASGTGIQEVTTIIDRLGEGVVHAIGTGGRDLSDKVGAITMMDAIRALENHNQTEVITIISKPPAKEVRDRVVQLLRSLSKPVVTIFLGEKPEQHEGNVYQAYTLEETARISVDLAKGNDIKEDYNNFETSVEGVELKPEQTAIKGLYSGGTLAYEAATLISDALNLGKGNGGAEGFVLQANGHEVADLGDDVYTQGKPHPMIDPETRVKFMEKAAEDEKTAVILFDVVLGYGSHEDMAGALLPAIQRIKSNVESQGRQVHFVGTVCGTEQDPQSYKEQREKLVQAGVILRDSNNQAVRTALSIIGLSVEDVKKQRVEYTGTSSNEDLSISPQIDKLINSKPVIINIGLKSFTDSVVKFGGRVVQYDWRPIAGGNERMQKILSLLK